MPQSKDLKTINEVKKIFGARPRINSTYYRISINYPNSALALNTASSGLGDAFNERLRGIHNRENFKLISGRLISEHSEEFQKIKERIPKGVDFGIVRKCNNWISPPTFRWGLKISFDRKTPGFWKNWERKY